MREGVFRSLWHLSILRQTKDRWALRMVRCLRSSPSHVCALFIRRLCICVWMDEVRLGWGVLERRTGKVTFVNSQSPSPVLHIPQPEQRMRHLAVPLLPYSSGHFLERPLRTFCFVTQKSHHSKTSILVETLWEVVLKLTLHSSINNDKKKKTNKAFCSFAD